MKIYVYNLSILLFITIFIQPCLADVIFPTINELYKSEKINIFYGFIVDLKLYPNEIDKNYEKAEVKFKILEYLKSKINTNEIEFQHERLLPSFSPIYMDSCDFVILSTNCTSLLIIEYSRDGSLSPIACMPIGKITAYSNGTPVVQIDSDVKDLYSSYVSFKKYIDSNYSDKLAKEYLTSTSNFCLQDVILRQIIDTKDNSKICILYQSLNHAFINKNYKLSKYILQTILSFEQPVDLKKISIVFDGQPTNSDDYLYLMEIVLSTVKEANDKSIIPSLLKYKRFDLQADLKIQLGKTINYLITGMYMEKSSTKDSMTNEEWQSFQKQREMLKKAMKSN